MDDSTLPPTGDMSVDPGRDRPDKDGGDRYLRWNLGAAFDAVDDGERRMLLSLGTAVVTRWAQLPRDLQRMLFYTAAGASSPEVRRAVALFLHEHAEHHEDEAAGAP